MTNKQAKAYIIGQRQMNLAIDNQHGVDACNKAIEALDKMDMIEAIMYDMAMNEFELMARVREIIRG